MEFDEGQGRFIYSSKHPPGSLFGTEPPCDAFPGFRRKLARNRFGKMISVFAGGLVKKINLLAVAAAPFADQEMQP
ncbi:MAG TPA: hypothetical protein VKV04_14395 [Verrucomicrobiae bacterium]|nr:hypothetical protein [Verrucomicrobiae bacterium]